MELPPLKKARCLSNELKISRLTGMVKTFHSSSLMASTPDTTGDALAAADRAMYENKMSYKKEAETAAAS